MRTIPEAKSSSMATVRIGTSLVTAATAAEDNSRAIQKTASSMVSVAAA